MTDNIVFDDKAQNEVKRSAMLVFFITLAVILTLIVGGVGIVLILKCSFPFAGRMHNKKQTVYAMENKKDSIKKKEITVEYIESLLMTQDQLITAREDLTGELTIKEGKIPLLTKKGFSMSYNGYVKAGTDLANREIIVSDDAIILCFSEPQITDCCIDAESVVFYDKKRAVFNWSRDSDVTEAFALAEDDMFKRAIENGIIKMAEDEAEMLLRNLMDEVVDDYEIRIMWISDN